MYKSKSYFYEKFCFLSDQKCVRNGKFSWELNTHQFRGGNNFSVQGICYDPTNENITRHLLCPLFLFKGGVDDTC